MISTEDRDHMLERTRDLFTALRGGRIFLTGGTGFFGCWLLENFTHTVDALALDTRLTVLTRDPDTFKKKAPHLALHPAVELIHSDVRSFGLPSGEFTHIIHAATEASVALNRDNPALMKETITEGAKRVLELAQKNPDVRCLLVSSGAVYGMQPAHITHMPEDEDAVQSPLRAPSAYAEGKREAEQLWREYNKETGAGPIARCFAFVGPLLPLDTHFAVGNFIRDALSGGPVQVLSDGTPRRSYLYAADLAVWLWTILLKGERGRAYNVGSEEEYAVGEVADIVAHAVTPPIAVTIAKTSVQGSAAERYVPSTARARSELKLAQSIGLKEAVRRTIEWYAQKPVSPSFR